MTYNYHSHTYLCNHALGTPEEYILCAIDGGITHMGFSDHIPFVCGNGKESRYRVSTSDVCEYFSILNNLREKYKSQIDIKIGFEMEYYPKDFDRMLKSAIDYGAEYLILGEHFYCDESVCPHYAVDPIDHEDILDEHVNCVVAAIKTGVFTYVAHPDILNFTVDKDVYREKMRKICVASREYDIPLEINFLGMRRGKNYPNEDFWCIAGEEHSPVTFGFDAHDVWEACDFYSLVKAQELVEKYNLNYIGMPKLKKIR